MDSITSLDIFLNPTCEKFEGFSINPTGQDSEGSFISSNQKILKSS